MYSAQHNSFASVKRDLKSLLENIYFVYGRAKIIKNSVAANKKQEHANIRKNQKFFSIYFVNFSFFRMHVRIIKEDQAKTNIRQNEEMIISFLKEK